MSILYSLHSDKTRVYFCQYAAVKTEADPALTEPGSDCRAPELQPVGGRLQSASHDCDLWSAAFQLSFIFMIF